jgi:hypothetical protein
MPRPYGVQHRRQGLLLLTMFYEGMVALKLDYRAGHTHNLLVHDVEFGCVLSNQSLVFPYITTGSILYPGVGPPCIRVQRIQYPQPCSIGQLSLLRRTSARHRTMSTG